MSSELLGLIAGGVFGYLIGKDGRPVAADQFVATIRESKPRLYTAVHIDLSEARDKKPYAYSGYSITVQNPEVSSVAVNVSVNESEAETVDITKTRKIHAPFYQFFVTNAAASGTLVLLISHTPFFEPICDLSTLVKGVNSGNAVPIAVDANGNMLALMKGDYEGALKTIATDSKGRMLAVVTDPEDVWGIPHYTGLAEHAVRLGSVSSFYPTGNVLFFDAFDSLSKVVFKSVSSGGSISISNLYTLHGDFSCRMSIPASGGGLIQYRLSYPVQSRMGFEFSWFQDDGNLDNIELDASLQDGANIWKAVIKWQKTGTMGWYYKDHNGVWQLIGTTANYHTSSAPFNHAKLVADFLNKEFVKLIANDTEYDLAGIDLHTYPSTVVPLLTCTIDATAADAGDHVCHIGHFIVTRNEP